MSATNPTQPSSAQPLSDQPPADQPPAAYASREPRTLWRDRVLGARGVAGVAPASLLLGGLGGAVIGFAVEDGRDGEEHGHEGRGGPGPMSLDRDASPLDVQNG